MDPLKTLGFNVRVKRELRALTQEQLAEKADLHWTFVSGIERGIRNVSILKLLRIAKALETPLSELLAGLD